MRERKSIAVFLVVFIGILMSNLSVFAFDDENARSSLKGLRGVYVQVIFSTNPIEELEKVGLSKETIRTDVELKLRLAGINVVPRKEDLYDIPGIPQLVVDISGFVVRIDPAIQEKGIAFHINVELLQNTYLIRNIQLTALGGTWSIATIGLGYTDQDIVTQIRNCVKDLSDRFINVYLSVNPKGGK